MDTPKKNPEVSPLKKNSLWQKLVRYTSNDQDYTAPIKIVKTTGPEKPKQKGKRIKAALTIFVTFYLLLCAFVLLNPQYALFFNNVLGVQYLTVRTTLEYTIYTVYSIFGIWLGAGFLFFGYRALAIKTKSRLKRTNIWMLTIFFCAAFFSNIALFAWTYDWFRRIDFNNLDGRVLIYDNTILKYIEPTNDPTPAQLGTDVKIGPINVRYDLSAYIKRMARLEGLVFSQPYTFEIDYDGDKKPDRGSGRNNNVERPISDIDYAPILTPEFAYDKPGTYKPTASIEGTDVGGKSIKIELDIPAITIEKVVTIGRTNLANGGIQYTFDAGTLADLGLVRWSVLWEPSMSKDGYQFSPEKIFNPPTIICAQIFRWKAPISDTCDWRFVTQETTKSNIQDTAIKIKIDPLNTLKYQFSVEPKAVQGDIRAVRWFIDGDMYVGKFASGTEKIFDYTFHDPGTYKVEAEIEDSLGNIVRVATPEPIFTAEMVDLKEWFWLTILDEEKNNLANGSYDKVTQSYLLPDFPVPWILKLDATKIRANSPRLRLLKVEWDTNNDGVYDQEWLSLEHDLQLPGRYDIRGKYTFVDISVDGKDVPILHIDRIAVVGVEKPIDVRVRITPDHSYAPATVRFDASGSKIKKWDIRKFIYDFWNGKTYEGEGVVTTYKYDLPGEYTITVTAVANSGERASKSYILLLKKPQETARIKPSIASGLGSVDLPITFEAMIAGTEKSILWDFGDGNGTKEGKTILYSFQNPGTYKIQMKVLYTSWIEESDTILYTVQ